jgi:hypothetical protein
MNILATGVDQYFKLLCAKIYVTFHSWYMCYIITEAKQYNTYTIPVAVFRVFGQSDTGTVFFPVLLFCRVSIILPVVHTLSLIYH